MTNQSPESVIAEALVNAGAPLMHSRVEERVAADLRAANMLREPCVPDAATAALERVRKYADERSVYAKTRNSTVGSWRIASDLYDILNVPIEEQAALDGAPEPEVKP